MITSEAGRPADSELTGELNEAARAQRNLDSYSFAGMRPDGTPRFVRVRTFRESIFLSSADDGPNSVHFNARTRVVTVNPETGIAHVVDVVSPPAGKRQPGELRMYAIADFTTGEPHVTAADQDTFIGSDAYNMVAPEGGYIKVYSPHADEMGYAGNPASERLLKSGDLDTAQWNEFAVAQKVEGALGVYHATQTDSPQ